MKKLVTVALGLAVLLLVVATAGAVDTNYTYWQRITPIIDGTIDWDEWAGAYRIDLTGPPVTYFYMKSDGQYLYLAWDVTGDTTNSGQNDQAMFYFDTNNDNTWPSTCVTSNEGRFTVAGNNNTYFRPFSTEGTCTAVTGPAAIVATAASFASGHMVYETKIDFTVDPMNLDQGADIGFAMYYFDNAAGYLLYPTDASIGDPTLYADLFFATEPEEIDIPYVHIPPRIDGVFEDEEWNDAVVVEAASMAGGVDYTAYYLADAGFLYGAFVTNDTTLTDTDEVMVYFDNDYNGGWPADCSDEGNYWLDYHAAGNVAMFRPWQEYSVCSTVPAEHVYSATTFQGDGNVVFEFRVASNSTEMNVGLGDSIGLRTGYTDWTTFGWAQWPEEAMWMRPGTYARANLPEFERPQVSIPWAEEPPTIDGDLDAGEWDDALEIPVIGDLEYDLHLMANGDYLYLAVDDLGDVALSSGDRIDIYFDSNNDEAWPTSCGNEGYLSFIYGAGGPTYMFTAIYGAGIFCAPVAGEDIVGAFGTTAEAHVQFEVRMDMAGGQFSANPGDAVGFVFYTHDTNIGDGRQWPYIFAPIPAYFAEATFPTCDGCYIDYTCHPDGTVNPDNECQWCDTTVATDGWSDHDGIACTSNGTYCDGEEICSAGACTSPGDPCGDDGEYCNGTESCDETNDQCVSSGDPCDADETCDETNDECVENVDDDSDDDADDDVTDDDITDDDITDDDVTDDDSDDDDDDDTADGGGGDDDDDSGCGC